MHNHVIKLEYIKKEVLKFNYINQNVYVNPSLKQLTFFQINQVRYLINAAMVEPLFSKYLI